MTQVDRVISTSKLGRDGGKTGDKSLSYHRTAMVTYRGRTMHLVETAPGTWSTKWGNTFKLPGGAA